MERNAVWRRIDASSGGAGWNMALDEALMHSALDGRAPSTLRFYTWDRQSVSLGRFQDVRRTVHWETCRAHGIPLVRRLTGGRAVLHGEDLTLSLSARYADLGFQASGAPSVAALYEITLSCLSVGFNRLGVDVGMGACSRISYQERRGDCFGISSQADLIDRRSGRKLLGSAICRRDHGCLQQISIPMQPPLVCRGKVALPLLEKKGASRSSNTSLSKNDLFVGGGAQEDPPPFTGEDLIEAMVFGFSQVLGITLENLSASLEERRVAAELEARRYTNEAWTLDGIDR